MRLAGEKPAVVWHLAQSRWLPCLVPWQFEQRGGCPITDAYRFRGWHFEQAIFAWRPVRRYRVECLNVVGMKDVVVWHEPQFLRPPCFEPWQFVHGPASPITLANSPFG